MTVLILEPDLQGDLRRALDFLPETAETTQDDSDLRRALGLIPTELLHGVNHVFDVALQVLRDNSYVQIRGFPIGADARSILLLSYALGSVFAELSHMPSVVDVATPSLKATLQGNQTEALFLHSDFAMLDDPPEASIIQCVEPDPLGYPFGESGVAVARHIVSRYFGTSKLRLVQDTPMPFAGKMPDGVEIVTMRPIIELTPHGDPRVRFNPSRIHHGFRCRGELALPQELEVLAIFQEMARSVRISLQLTKGDVLIVNNRTALHDRGLCSLSLSRKGLRARISRILFVQQLNEKAGW